MVCVERSPRENGIRHIATLLLLARQNAGELVLGLAAQMDLADGSDFDPDKAGSPGDAEFAGELYVAPHKTMAKRLQGELDESSDVPDLAEVLDEDYESLDETADEWNGQP